MAKAMGRSSAGIGRFAWPMLAALLAAAVWVVLAQPPSDAAELEGPLHDSHVVVVIQEGDTLWDLVLPYAPAGADPHEWVARVADANDVEPQLLRPGRVVRVPIG